jgi:hydroxyacylglutathione hydrolase
MLNLHKISGDIHSANCYIIDNGSDAVIIDPGGELGAINLYLDNLHPIAILCTHGHYDHIQNVHQLKMKYRVPFYLHSDDKRLMKHANFYLKLVKGPGLIEIPEIDICINDSEILDFSFVQFKVIHTPGHTEGSVCFSFGNNLITGDLLMKNNVGRTDLPGGNPKKILGSVKTITDKFPDVNIFPGHEENTNMKTELEHNRRLIDMLNK